METDLQTLARLAAKLVGRTLHDVAGPVAGLSAALDLLGDSGADPGLREDAIALARQSLEQISEKMRFCRAAFSGAGLDDQSLAPLLSAPFAKGRARLEAVSLPADTPADLRSSLLILALIGAESLARGGEARIVVEKAGGQWEASLTAEGPRAQLHPETVAGLTGKDLGEGLPGRWAPSAYLRALTLAAGGRLEISEGTDGLAVRLERPDAGAASP